MELHWCRNPQRDCMFRCYVDTVCAPLKLSMYHRTLNECCRWPSILYLAGVCVCAIGFFVVEFIRNYGYYTFNVSVYERAYVTPAQKLEWASLDTKMYAAYSTQHTHVRQIK